MSASDEPVSPRTWSELTAAVEAAAPGSAIEASWRGELVVYTGLRLDRDDMTLLPYECPSCSAEDLDDEGDGCADLWHPSNRRTAS